MLQRLLPNQPQPDNETFQEMLLSGWGRTAPSLAHVIRPESDEHITTVLRDAPSRGIIARGLGRSYGDPAQNAGGVVVDMTGHAAVHAFDVQNATISVDAGMSLSMLANLIVPFGCFLPVSPGTQFVTVGGAIACDIHGKNHHLDGSFGEHILSFVLLTPGGDKVELSPGSNPDLFWATVGGLGLTGIILRATIALPRVETASFAVDIDRTADLDEVMQLQSDEDDKYQYSVAWVDCIARGSSLGRSILMRGNHASLDALPNKAAAAALVRRSRPQLPSPPWAPTGLLRPASVKILNEVWYRKAPRRKRDMIQSIDAFFYPLDVLSGWNRFYGAGGFLQYQFVVPDEEADIVRRIIETLADGKWPTALAVLKRMGGSRGLMSFALPGWTLAVDIPTNVSGLGKLLDSFDDIVAEAGGRVYLAKDSRMRPDMIPAMYPNLARWRDTLDSIDPERRMRSDLERRLQLRERELPA